MPAQRKPRAKSLSAKVAEIAFASPQVVAHRVARMAMAGPLPSKRDRKEFERMGAEKSAAFQESWSAMAAQVVRANQALTVSVVRSLLSPSLDRRKSATALASEMRIAAMGVLDKGMAPVHRRAVANTKRLARTKLR